MTTEADATANPNGWADRLFEWGRAQRAAAHPAVPVPVAPSERPELRRDDDETPRSITDPLAYGRRALDSAVDNVRQATEGMRNHTLNAAAYSLGRLVAAELLDEATVIDTLHTAAEECGLDPAEIGATAASGLYAGMARPILWQQSPSPAGAVTVDVATGEVVSDAGLALEITRQRNARLARRQLDTEDAAALYTPVRLKALGMFLAEPSEPVVWVVDKLLRHGFNATLSAPNKTGKTITMADLVRALADREPFMGRWDVGEDDVGRVALFDYEMWPDDHRDKLAALGVRHIERVSIVHMRGLRAPLSDDSVCADIVDQLRREEIGVWFIDPFARAFTGDENDNGEVGRWLDRLDVIKREAGVHSFVMPVHTGRREAEVGEERSRGAMRLDDWPDMLWRLSRDKEGNRYFAAEGRAGQVDIELVTLDPISNRLRMGGGSPQFVAQRRIEVEALRFVIDNPGCSQASVAKGVRGNDRGVIRALDQLVRTFHIRRDGAGAGTAFHYFANVSETPS